MRHYGGRQQPQFNTDNPGENIVFDENKLSYNLIL